MRKQQPTFLIITPSYNQAQFIRQTIESVLNQTGVKVKYVVFDGRSNDKTTTVLRSFKKGFFWKSERDNGQTDAINKGILHFKNIKGEAFFAYINSDDYYLPDAFQTVAEHFAKNPKAQWLVGECQIVDGKNQPLHSVIRLYKKILRQLYQPWMLFILNPIPQPAVFIRWDAMKKIGTLNDSLRYVMDYELWLRLQKKFGPPLFIEQTLAAFRIHHASKGGSQFPKQFAEELTVAKKFTRSPLFFFAHQLHNWLILSIYEIIK